MSSISVIIPAYNAEKYIGAALESALAQTRPAAEIIVVDDGSADGTAAVADGFGRPVRLIRNSENLGVGASRNRGVQASRGEYVAYLDADDQWRPNHLANLGALLDAHARVGFAFSPVEFFGEKTGQWPGSVAQFAQPRNCFFDLLRNLPCVPSGLMIRRSLHDAIGWMDESVYIGPKGRRIQQGEDLDYVIRAARIAEAMACPEPTALYRWHPGQASVLRDEQIVLAFVYRLRILDSLAESRTPAAELALARDRVLRCWEGHIEELWRKRNSRGLRMMVRFGFGKRLLVRATWPYAVKAGLPQAVARRI